MHIWMIWERWHRVGHPNICDWDCLAWFGGLWSAGGPADDHCRSIYDLFFAMGRHGCPVASADGGFWFLVVVQVDPQ